MSYRGYGSASQPGWRLCEPLRESDLYRSERSRSPRREPTRGLASYRDRSTYGENRTSGRLQDRYLDSRDRYGESSRRAGDLDPSRDLYQTPPGYPSRTRDLTYGRERETDLYRSSDRYATQDRYLGSSRDPYRETGRDRFPSLTVDARHTALPYRRYESSLTYRDDTSRRDSRDTYRSTPAGSSSRYDDLVRPGESAGGTPSRYARYAEGGSGYGRSGGRSGRYDAYLDEPRR